MNDLSTREEVRYPPEVRERIQRLEKTTAELFRYGTDTLDEDPKPLRVITHRGPLKAQMLADDEPPVLVPYATEERMPVHLRHPFAVYELAEGQFTVTRNGEWWGHPFETTDAALARMVCDRWAQEFPEPDPGPNADARADIHRIASELRLLSRRG